MLSHWLHFQSRMLSLSSGPTPNRVPEPIEPPSDALPVLRKGSTGPAVVKLQELLPKWIDGDFGSTTDALVREFQRSQGLAVDGVVGEADLGGAAGRGAAAAANPAEGWIPRHHGDGVRLLRGRAVGLWRATG